MSTPVLPVPWPDETLGYSTLPVSGDDGLPHAVLLDIGGVVYRLTLGISFTDPSFVLSSSFAATLFDLPDPDRGIYLTLRVESESQPDATRLVGVQRVVPDVPMRFGPLRVRFSRMKIAQPNLSGPGQFGSELIGEVAVANA